MFLLKKMLIKGKDSDKICTPKNEVGLAIKKTQNVNVEFFAKQGRNAYSARKHMGPINKAKHLKTNTNFLQSNKISTASTV